MKNTLCLALVVISWLLTAPRSRAQEVVSPGLTPPEKILQVQTLFSFDRAYRGSTLRAALIGRIAAGWHVNSHQPNEEFLIPTAVVLDEIAGVTVKAIVYPPGLTRTFAFSETPLSVYEQEFLIGLELAIAENFSGPEVALSGKLTYQACNDYSCLAPESEPFRATLPVVGLEQPANLINEEVFQKIDFGGALAATAGTAGREGGNEVSGLIAQHGLGTALLFIFIGGLALNLTPCVYPLIPITISYFGGQTGGQPAKVFGLALLYILGMALTYSALGVLAALSGSLFGAALQSPPVLSFIALVMVALALSMFGLYEFKVPQALTQLAGGAKPGYFGAFFMGLTVGFVAAPCIGPFVLGLLTYVGTTGNPLLGFWMFFVLALGLGAPFLLLGTFSGLLQNLPRSGMWMVWVKKIFGVILLAMAAYFIAPILPSWLGKYLLPAILLAGGVYVGLIESSKFASAVFPWLKRATAAVFVALAVWLAWPEQQAHAGVWQPLSETALAQARRESKPVIIDFTADWCLACKELERFTFPHEAVLARAGSFLMLRGDLTQYGSPEVQAIRQQYQIKGLPTVVFLDAEGRERSDLRVIGFVDGKEFARRMAAVTGN
ncbi:MAG: thioredoxin family protein [candidate division KSB1 bacterium]|nr:thioredoxin family protein [candidate division KSB1 bacterium]MDZ7273950.1 thioredoxin family protein [candidate division KSB1 bacterium]MDZ7286106.1 thioredoxin family protein [candidate division KSB1 bacterium]MDZ7299138.1 thioredoxin family protein [candidate division KSB1 bacterium]MDZ7308335.1 thioredoxin family protein [candidate division KSB1 bacterium]